MSGHKNGSKSWEYNQRFAINTAGPKHVFFKYKLKFDDSYTCTCINIKIKFLTYVMQRLTWATRIQFPWVKFHFFYAAFL